MEHAKLKMSFDPHTIEHLGVKMYSQLPNAIAELIANSYDAESPDVHIILSDDEHGKSISVIDSGVGMTFEEINENFLRIGRKRRESDNGLSPNGIRKVTGRKGLGKLAFFGIGDNIQITTKKDGMSTIFTMNWNDIIHSTMPEYEPKFKQEFCESQEHGTTIVLSNLKRKTPFDVYGLANSLSTLFDFFDNNFKADISLNGEEPIPIDKSLRYKNVSAQFKWVIPSCIDNPKQYLHAKQIAGELLATEKPLKPGFRGIALYAHGRMINAPEFFGVGESSHFYSYLTGWLDVDFVDEQDEDFISTDRQSLSWELPITLELRDNLKQLLSFIEKDWREKRKIKREQNITLKTKIDVSKWYPTLTPDIQKGVKKIVSSVVESSELEEEKQSEVIDALYALIPEYAQYHWRRLHQIVQDASYNDYKNEDFYRAAEEAIKRYETITKKKSGNNQTGRDLMAQVFGKDKILSVTSQYKKRDGSSFSSETQENVEDGQKFMSMGIMAGVRNPLAHEEKIELKETGLFSENDCLDILSLLSHLFRRLDNAVKRPSYD